MKKKGLTEQDVYERIVRGEVNGNCDMASKTYKQIVKEHVFTYFNFLNIFLAACVAFVHSYRNMLFLGVVFWNAIIGIVQEIRAKRVIDQMNILLESKAAVWRNGELIKLSTKDIVKDDSVVLQSGDQVYADLVITEGTCEVDESMLTGESDGVHKAVGEVILSGSHLLSGKIEGVVTAVGENNYANRIVKAAKTHKNIKSEIKDSIDRLIKVVSMVVLPLGVLMFLKQWRILEQPFSDAVVKTVASVISMIPDGLVLLASGVMAVSVVKLSKENAIVKELFSIENLARVDVLCLDKTGTITEGKMKLDGIVSCGNMEYKEALMEYIGATKDSNATIEAIKAEYEEKHNWNVKELIPFSSKRKWGGVIFEEYGGYILGAPELVLGKKLENYKKELEQYRKKGRRILTFARIDNDANIEEGGVSDWNISEKTVPMLFLALEDCIRENAKVTLKYFQDQGVLLKLISGDNVDTVKEIANQAGFENSELVVDARDLDTPEKINEAVKKYVVFGRTTPEQKRELVKALQSQGHVVGMTGDGVNDVLALKEADCSIVMDSGCDVARKTAKVVLVGSDFSTIPKVLEEGRRAINNLERSATLFLNKTTLATILLFVFLFLKVVYPLQPIQFTVINAITIGIPAFILALEPNYELVTGRFFKKVCRTAVPAGILAASNLGIIIAAASCLILDEKLISTLAVIGVVMANFFLLFFICKPWDKKRVILLVSLVILFCFVATLGADIFMLTRITRKAVLLLVAIAGIDLMYYCVVFGKGCPEQITNT